MEFNDWSTIHDVLRRDRSTHDTVPADAKQFYDRAGDAILKTIQFKNAFEPNDDCAKEAVAYNQTSVEKRWTELGRPYFKLYPGVMGMLINTDVRIPCEYVKAPLPSFLLRLPKGHDIADLKDEADNELQSVLVTEAEKGVRIRVTDSDELLDQRRFIFWFNFGERAISETGHNLPVVAFQHIAIEDESLTFDSCLDTWLGARRIDWDEGIRIPEETLLHGIRLAVGACLIAVNSPAITEHDVLNRHVSRYRDSKDPKEREALHQKAIRRGKQGWLLGRELSLQHRHYEAMERTGDDGSARRELKFSHMRRGHFHLYRHGPGRTLTKVRWLMPKIIRPDLPAQEATQ